MKREITVAGAILVALGALSLIEAVRLKDDWLGARLMPAVVGGLLLLLGLAHATYRGGDPAPWPDVFGMRRVAFVFAVLAGYIALLPTIGFLPATALFLLVVVRALGTYSWPMTVVWTAIIAGGSHVVFKRWLGMPLPAGPLGF